MLVVDDEKSIREVLISILQKKGYEVSAVGDIKSAESIISNEDFDVALVDMLLPDGDGKSLIPFAQRKLINVVMISGHATLSSAVEAVKMGAYDFLEKPLDREKMLIVIQNAVSETELKRKSEPQIVFASQKMKKVLEIAEKYARSKEPLLIFGETGSGKEILSRFIHRLSPNSKGPFIAVNCAAIPQELAESELFGHSKGAFTGAVESRKGKFQSADGGTLLLDEIGDLPLSLQAKLLRAIEEGKTTPVGSDKETKVDVRILAATNTDLEEMVKRGKFREDLFYRISGLKIEIPPLRERKEDIPILADHFLKESCENEGWKYEKPSQDFFEKLKEFEWRGNVRELKREMTRLVLFGEGKIETQLLDEIRAKRKDSNELRHAKIESESQKIVEVLRETKGNVKKAAEILKISRSNLYEKLKNYNINPNCFREDK
ncbi:MAG: sigma-54 dependent transcriptional regulator [Acidobacteria bacterium]|nr:sigma-54 dependent transcriptional regulator [Acidobacteriota bacterium]